MGITKTARNLRQNQTEAEKCLWLHLRSRQMEGCKFYRQFPVPPYYADFACRSAGLIVEIDGGQHADRKGYDMKRTAFMERKGYKVLRFWNNQGMQETEGVLQTIRDEMQALTRNAVHSDLSLKGEVK
ncbi:MAG: endonuclease domain-containing protein [Rhodospirillales bacterium]|nr:endonuclease domain-containing protein [Alphaproteobacteria bacterium]USO03414.1 MAG: endonuclease domain-containing protein [Rhodospirillales bacterium]